MASEGRIMLSYHDTLLRKSDVDLLDGRKWINDNVIAFWFEYLEYDLYREEAPEVAFISPQVAQFIKSAGSNSSTSSDVSVMLQSMDLSSKKLILLPINDHKTDEATFGGTHWSLLAYHSRNESFEHYDSHSGSVNRLQAEQVVNVLTPVLTPGRESDIELDLTEMGCSQQANGFDCGVHVMANSEVILRHMFRDEKKHISEVASPSAVKRMRTQILQLIHALMKEAKIETTKDTPKTDSGSPDSC